MKKLFVLALFPLVLSVSIVAQNGPNATTAAMTKPATTDKPKRGPIFRPTKDQIKEVQSILKDKKLYAGDASGAYNDATREGIKGFQKDNGLKQTGTLNRATLEKFGVGLTDAQKAIPVSQGSYDTGSTTKATTTTKKATIFRATKNQITAAQKILKDRSFYTGDTTGKLDDATRDGLKKYQDATGIKVTGTLNQITLDKMGIALTDKQKAASTSK